MDCKECVLARSCAQDKAFCRIDLIMAISDLPYMVQDQPTVIERYIKEHGYMIDMGMERDVTVINIVLVDGIPVQTPKWMVDIMEKLKESDGK